MQHLLRPGPLTLLLAVVAALAVGLAVSVVGTSGATTAAATTRTVAAVQGVEQTTVSGSGTLAPRTSRDLTFATTGTVSAVDVKAGEHVSAGQVLAKVDPDDAEVTLAQAEADLQTAEDAVTDASTAASSSSSSSTTPSTTTSTAGLDAKVAAAKLALADAQDAVKATKLRAPVAGTIAGVGVAVGDSVTSGSTTAAVTLVQLSRYTLSVSLSESDVGKVAVGQPATVTVTAADGEELAAHVTAVDLLSSDSSSATTSATSSATSSSSASAVSYPVTLELTQSSKLLKPGMSATAEIVTDQASGVTVPTAAISGGSVTVVKDGKRTVRQVQAGVAGDSTTIVTSGLTAGEDVLVTSASATAGAAATSTTSSSSSATGGVASALSGGGAAAGGGFAGGGGTGGPPAGGNGP